MPRPSIFSAFTFVPLASLRRTQRLLDDEREHAQFLSQCLTFSKVRAEGLERENLELQREVARLRMTGIAAVKNCRCAGSSDEIPAQTA